MRSSSADRRLASSVVEVVGRSLDSKLVGPPVPATAGETRSEKGNPLRRPQQLSWTAATDQFLLHALWPDTGAGCTKVALLHGDAQRCASVRSQRPWPVMSWQQFSHQRGSIVAKDHLGVQVAWVDLPDELAAAAARR